jgi:uncharacterized protein YukE
LSRTWVNLGAVRGAAADLEQRAAALAGLALPVGGPPAGCPLTGAAHRPYLDAHTLLAAALRGLSADLAGRAADLAAAATRTERADQDAAARFERLHQEGPC